MSTKDIGHWFVDVSYSWTEITHVDRYVVTADSARMAESETMKRSMQEHIEWREAREPPRITYRVYPADRVVMVESGCEA